MEIVRYHNIVFLRKYLGIQDVAFSYYNGILENKTRKMIDSRQSD